MNDLYAVGRVILQFFFKETALEAVNWSDVFEYACEYERSNDFLVYIKCEEFPNFLQNYYFLMTVSSVWSYLTLIVLMWRIG